MAREKKHKEPLGEPLSFRPTVADREKYLDKITASGMSRSEFFRDYVLKNKTEVIARKKPTQDKQRLVYLFNKTSNNINQLAHRAHLDYNAGTISDSSYGQLIQELQLLSRYMKAVIKDVD